MKFQLHQLPVKRPLDLGFYKTTSYVSQYDSPIILIICFFSFFLLNPFLAIPIVAIFSLVISGNSKSILLMLIISLTLFYSSRNFGVRWNSGEDDAYQYLFNYQSSLKDNLSYLFDRFYINRSKTEPFYYSFWWIIGKLFDPEPKTFFFLIFLFQVTLLSIASYLVSKRYAIIFIFIFYFGISDPNHQILHLWRASFAFFIFLIGIIIYFNGNKKIGRILIYSSIGFHVSILINIVIFELYNFLSRRRSFMHTVVLGIISILILSLFYRIIMPLIFPSSIAFFYAIDAYVGFVRIIIYLAVAITLLAINYFNKLTPLSLFATFLFIMYMMMLFLLGVNNPIMTRLMQITVPIVGLALFEVVMKQSKAIIALICIILTLHFIIQPINDMYAKMLPQYMDVFYGVSTILVL